MITSPLWFNARRRGKNMLQAPRAGLRRAITGLACRGGGATSLRSSGGWPWLTLRSAPTRAADGDPAEQGSVWQRVDQWDKAIEEEFFAGQWAERPVYLDLEDEHPEADRDECRVAAERDPVGALAELLRPTFHLEPGQGLLSEHLARERRWSDDGGRDAAIPGSPRLLLPGRRDDAL